MYLLDTNVISEVSRKAKKTHQNVKKWAEFFSSASLYISVISVLELEIGILLIDRRDKEKGTILRAWMDRHVLPTFSGRAALAILTLPSPASDARRYRCRALTCQNTTLRSRRPPSAARALVHSCNRSPRTRKYINLSVSESVPSTLGEALEKGYLRPNGTSPIPARRLKNWETFIVCRFPTFSPPQMTLFSASISPIIW